MFVRSGDSRLSPFHARPLFRLALAGVLAASLGLAGCGRKGPLDPPPGANLSGVAQANPSELMSDTGRPKPIGSADVDGNPGVGANGQIQAPKGPEKRIPLDVLLN
jgi:predicted small lipoprotein YifL